MALKSQRGGKAFRGYADNLVACDSFTVPRRATQVRRSKSGKEERRQWVFHVMVSDRYSSWRESQDVVRLAGLKPFEELSQK